MGEIHVLRERLRLPATPFVLDGLDKTIAFFRSALDVNPLDWLEYVRGIDFHNEVAVRTLLRGTKLVQYRPLSRSEVSIIPPFGFFTRPGVSPFQLGWSRPEWEPRSYITLIDTPVLTSTAASLSYGPRDRLPDPGHQRDHISRVGGGVQYIISRAAWPKLLRVGTPKRF